MILSLMSLESQGQSYYNFSQTTGVYKSIVSPSYTLKDSTTITDNSLLVQINFSSSSQLPKTAFGETISGSIFGGRNGFMAASGDSSDFTFDPFLTSLVSNGSSEVRFKDTILGTDSIFEIEWFKFGISNHPAVDYLTFKLRFNLSKEIIEYWYGPSNITSTNPFSAQAPSIVLFKASKGFTSTKEIAFLTGNPNNPNFSSNAGTINAFPANGTIYKFSGPNVTSIKKVFAFQKQIKLWPNPAKNTLNIENIQDVKSLSILSIDGKLFHQAEKPLSSKTISLANYPSGLYVVNCLFNDGSVGVTKLIVE